jgi:hypothetical protein
MLASTLTVLHVRNPSKNDGFRIAPLYEISRNVEQQLSTRTDLVHLRPAAVQPPSFLTN